MELFKLQLSKYIKYNYLDKRIKKRASAKVLPMKSSAVCLAKSAKMELFGNFKINANGKARNIGRSTICRIDDNASLTAGLNGKSFQLYYGCDVIVFSGGNLILKSGFCNSDTKIRCKSKIVIGEDAVISHNVTIEDFDGHQMYNIGAHGEREALESSSPITIGNHVWIGCKAIILKGVTIGDGAVVAAGSVVTSDIPPHSLCAGVPARVIRENVEWE